MTFIDHTISLGTYKFRVTQLTLVWHFKKLNVEFYAVKYIIISPCGFKNSEGQTTFTIWSNTNLAPQN